MFLASWRKNNCSQSRKAAVLDALSLYINFCNLCNHSNLRLNKKTTEIHFFKLTQNSQ
jgi:hypothetical protein